MPRHASYLDIGQLHIPQINDFGNPQFDATIPHLQLYETWNVGRFLYFRFDERNWLPKKAIAHYNREWPHYQLGPHLVNEAKRKFLHIRDNTQQNFFLGLASVVTSWLDATRSGKLYRQQYSARRERYDEAVAQAAANNTRDPPEFDLDIATSRFPRGPGRVPNDDDQDDGILDPNLPATPPPFPAEENEGANPPPSPPHRQRLYLNRFLPFFSSYVKRPKCVKHCWKYNLEFVNEELRRKWDVDNPYGDPAVPLFEGLTKVVEELAPTMLIHVLEHRRQRWAESGLINKFAHTTRHTMNAENVDMEMFYNAGTAGFRANRWVDLVVSEREDRILGTPKDSTRAADPFWDADVSW